MNRVQIKLIDPSHGKIIVKTFDGTNCAEQALAYLHRLVEGPQKRV